MTLHSDHSFCSDTSFRSQFLQRHFIQITVSAATLHSDHSFCSDTSFRSQFLQRHFIQITVSAVTFHSDHSFCSDTSFRSQFLQQHFIQITVSAATLHSDHSFCSDTSFRSQFIQITVSAVTFHSDHSFCSDISFTVSAATLFRSQFLQQHFIHVTVSAATFHSDHSCCNDDVISFRSNKAQRLKILLFGCARGNLTTAVELSNQTVCCSSNRTCQRPMYSKQGTSAFIQPKMGREGDEVDTPQVRQGPSRLARPSAAYFSAMGDQNQEEGTQDEGEGEGAGQTQAPPPPDRPLQRMVTAIPRRMEERIGVMNSEGGLEIMSAVRTHTARQILKRKKKVSNNRFWDAVGGVGGGGGALFSI